MDNLDWDGYDIESRFGRSEHILERLQIWVSSKDESRVENGPIDQEDIESVLLEPSPFGKQHLRADLHIFKINRHHNDLFIKRGNFWQISRFCRLEACALRFLLSPRPGFYTFDRQGMTTSGSDTAEQSDSQKSPSHYPEHSREPSLGFFFEGLSGQKLLWSYFPKTKSTRGILVTPEGDTEFSFFNSLTSSILEHLPFIAHPLLIAYVYSVQCNDNVYNTLNDSECKIIDSENKTSMSWDYNERMRVPIHWKAWQSKEENKEHLSEAMSSVTALLVAARDSLDAVHAAARAFKKWELTDKPSRNMDDQILFQDLCKSVQDLQAHADWNILRLNGLLERCKSQLQVVSIS